MTRLCLTMLRTTPLTSCKGSLSCRASAEVHLHDVGASIQRSDCAHFGIPYVNVEHVSHNADQRHRDVLDTHASIRFQPVLWGLYKNNQPSRERSTASFHFGWGRGPLSQGYLAYPLCRKVSAPINQFFPTEKNDAPERGRGEYTPPTVTEILNIAQRLEAGLQSEQGRRPSQQSKARQNVSNQYDTNYETSSALVTAQAKYQNSICQT